ncbi:MAG: TolC family protein [Bacteroidetes bacterium]|nr:TolC family protein [Bacteroidota bacterium]
MKWHIKAGILFTFLVFHVLLPAQSIDELLTMAVENNLELKALYQEYLAALEKGDQVNELPDPEVAIGMFVLSPETRVGPQWVRIGASQMFPWKGTLLTKEKMVLTMAKTKYEQVEATKLDVYFKLKSAWFQLYELDKSRTIIQRNLRILRSLERLSLVKVESGKASMADVLFVQIKIQELENKLKLLINKKKKPLTVINQLINRPLDSNIIISDSLSLAYFPFDKKTFEENVFTDHPKLRIYSIQQEIAKQAIELSHLNAKPSFGVGLDYILVGKRKDMEVNNNGKDILMPKLMMKVPIYRKKYDAKQREEELKIAALNNRKEELKSKFLALIEQAFTDQEDARLKIQLYGNLQKTTQATIEILLINYSTTNSGFNELLRLQMQLIDYDLEILKAIVQSHLAKALVETMMV